MRNWLRRLLKWMALTVSALLAAGVVALFIGYWISDNDCEARRATTPKNPMKAITYCDYGGPEVLRLEEVERPVPSDDQVLVRVRAVALNPYDLHFLHGTPYVMRLSAGLRRPKLTGIGVDFPGVVESVGWARTSPGSSPARRSSAAGRARSPSTSSLPQGDWRRSRTTSASSRRGRCTSRPGPRCRRCATRASSSQARRCSSTERRVVWGPSRCRSQSTWARRPPA